jgi:hypothetical protein
MFFNGATAEPLGRELVGIFKDEAWSGGYAKFDRSRIGEVYGTYAKDRLYYTLPLLGGGRALLVVDSTWGSPMFSIDDGRDYRQVDFLPTEGRLVGLEGILSRVYWFFLDEGLVEEGAHRITADPPPPDEPIPFDWHTFLIPMAADHTGSAKRFAVDLDPGGNTVNVDVTVDDDPALSHTYIFSGLGRREEKRYLPAHFKGRYLRVRFYGGAMHSRVRVYKLRLVAEPRGDL